MGIFRIFKDIFAAPSTPRASSEEEASYNSGEKSPYYPEKNPSFYNGGYPTDDLYFAHLITEENFPGHTVLADVSPRRFDPNAHPSCFPISYLFEREGEPVLAVLIMNPNQYRSMIAKGTYEVLAKARIPYLRFFKGMENDREYVLSRIREDLGLNL